MIVFLLAAISAFFIPGDIFVRRLTLTSPQRIVLALGLGMVLWALQGFIFGFLGMRNLTYVYIGLAVIVWLLKRPKISFSLPHPDWLTVAIIALGVALQLSAVWFLGTNRDGGLFFCCRGVPDDIYHLALTNQLVNHFPPQEPGMVGMTVKNYHYLASLEMADLIRIFHLPLVPTVYQYFALLVSTLLGATVVAIAQLLALSKKSIRLWLFFLYFHGDILYLLLFLRGKGLNFDVTIFDDATKLLAGPPRSFSILLLFGGMALFIVWIKKRNLLSGIIIAVVFGSLIGFKVYTGIFAMIGMTAVAGFFLIKRDWKMLAAPILVLLISSAIYIPVNGANGGLIFNGAYRFENFISQPVFGLTNLELIRLDALAHGNILKAAGLELFFGIAFLVFLYGTSLLAIFQSKKTLGTLPRELNIFLLSAIGVTAIVGLSFLQNIGGLNTVQFLISLYFVGSLFAALVVSRFPLIAILIVILLTLPRPLYEAWGNVKMLTERQGLFISGQELQGLDYLKNNTPPDAVVSLPPELATKEISLYVSFLADRPLYVAGYTGVLQDHQVPGAKERLNRPDYSEIDYLYIPRQYKFSPIGQEIFSNSAVQIYQVQNSRKN